MIERDRRDHAHKRMRDDIRRIEPAAETNFQQQDIGRMPREQEQTGGGRDLEARDRLAGILFFTFGEHGIEIGIGNETPAARRRDAKPLVEARKMR